MKLIEIDISSEPKCLSELKINGGKYSDLKGQCQKDVRQILLQSQAGHCAYCEKRLQTVFIEHYISQKNCPSKDLDFDNFLGVCSGKDYLNPPANNHIPHCGNNRGFRPLNINPKKFRHINTIYYESDATIRSTNSIFEHDINNVLNLNYNGIKNKRNATFLSNLNNLIKVAQLQGQSNGQAYINALEYAKNGSIEYSSYVVFRYEELINASKVRKKISYFRRLINSIKNIFY